MRERAEYRRLRRHHPRRASMRSGHPLRRQPRRPIHRRMGIGQQFATAERRQCVAGLPELITDFSPNNPKVDTATTTTVPVLIVGGGATGLSASMILSTLDVPTLLVSALPTTSILPKAHVLGQRTMEFYTEVGVAEAIYEKGTPPENLVATGFYAGLAGTHPNADREIGKLEIWGAADRDPEYIDASPCPTAKLPRVRLEPILKVHAESLQSRMRAIQPRADRARPRRHRRPRHHPRQGNRRRIRGVFAVYDRRRRWTLGRQDGGHRTRRRP